MNGEVRPCIAGVCVLDNPYAIDGIYDYRIPQELTEDVRPGVFVTVPFGTVNRRALALVKEVREHSDYPKLKSVTSVCPESLSLDAEMLGLCDFMKMRTLCSTGDAVRAMIPASVLSRLVAVYRLFSEYQQNCSDELSSSDLFVYEFIHERGEASLPQLRERFGAGVEARLRRMCNAKYLQKTVVWKDAPEGLTQRIWTLAVSHDAAGALIEDGEADGYRVTSPKQKEVIRVLLEGDLPMSTQELTRAAGVTEAPLRSLLAKGILATGERRIDRNPYAAAKVTGRTPITLNEEQSDAMEKLWELASSGDAKAALLHGVTGSGKTAVMTSLIDRMLDHGKGVILLLPEIALTPQSVSIFCARYGQRVAVIHSALSAGERYDAFCRIRDGKADVVIGTRSAVFSPVKNLGAIIIDEEQEHTYKSDQNPKYHARDIARFRCAHHKALMLLASATPSLESYRRAEEGAYALIRLTKRYGGAVLPKVRITDMRREAGGGNASPLGTELLEALCQTVAAGEQAILFLNRRGYNHFISCRSCGKALTCPSCSVSMTYHTRRGTYDRGDLVCHWCGKRIPVPTVCPDCGSEHLARMGFGTQRVEEELKKLMPEARILRMDTDTTSTKFAYDEMLGRFRAHEADILLGTQMVTKGHDFPDVTLVGVLLADMSLYLDDYRASEKTFSMLTQVIGRAGRGKHPGQAIIQTNNPDNEIIRLACDQDYDTFYDREIRLRRLLVFPPFCDVVLLTLSGALENELLKTGEWLAAELKGMAEGDYSDVPIVTFGPFEAPVYRVDNKYRLRMVLKCRINRRSLAMLSDLECAFYSKTNRKISLNIDMNPSNL